MITWLYERYPTVRLWTSWILTLCMVWYMYGYSYYYIFQGKNPEEEYKRQCKDQCEKIKEELQKTENGREILRLLKEQPRN